MLLLALDITQFADQVRMRLISQLSNGISRALQNLLKYFNGTSIWTASVPSSPAEPAIFCSYLNETLLPGKLARDQQHLKLVHLHSIAINFLIFLNNYCYVLLNYTLVLLN